MIKGQNDLNDSSRIIRQQVKNVTVKAKIV